MNIKPYDKTIRELLGSGKQFLIPRFQREYSWDKRNYKEFFEDMLGSLNIDGGKIIPEQYFLGTMLFVGDYPDGAKAEVDVVDGQQRMTTITILFSAISDRFRSIREHTLSEQIFKYIMTTDDNGESVRILKSKTHYPFFSYYIQTREKEKIEDPTSEEEETIQNAYEYMYSVLDEESLRKFLKKSHGSDNVESLKYIDMLKAIRDQVLGATFISISTTERNQANMIFEILNAKGKKLSNVDLIKNKIFEVVNKTEPADFADEEWKKVKTILSSRENGIALATFYRHYWISKYKKTPEVRLYDDFRAEIKPKTEDRYKKFLNELVKESQLYVQIISPERGDYKNRKEYFGIVQSLNVLSNYFSIVQVRVALLALFDAKNRDLLTLADLKESIYYFENFHFAYNSIAKLPSNRFEGIYSSFAIDLRKCEDKIAARNLIANIKNNLAALYPAYQEFENEFIKLSFSKKENSSNIKSKYALNKINSHYQDSEVFSDDGSIEHIAPGSENEDNINIGNLIVLETPLNTEADALCYNKRVTVYRKSNYNWIKRFIDEHPMWENNMIERRAKQLANIYFTNVLGRSI